MFSKEQVEKHRESKEFIWEIKAQKVGALCLLTSLLAGLTVWSINGTITSTVRTYYGETQYNDTVVTNPVDPVLQGILAFLTVALLFLSMALVISLQLDKLKTK